MFDHPRLGTTKAGGLKGHKNKNGAKPKKHYELMLLPVRNKKSNPLFLGIKPKSRIEQKKPL